jgi:hypothetical protein
MNVCGYIKKLLPICIVYVGYDNTRTFGRGGYCFSNTQFSCGICFKTAMPFYVLWLEIGKYKRIERHSFVSQWLSTARRKNFCKKKRPGIVILYKLRSHSVSTVNCMVLADATFAPEARNIAESSSTTEDLPLVPVTAITISLREGNPYQQAPKCARKKWYACSTGSGRMERIKVFIR